MKPTPTHGEDTVRVGLTVSNDTVPFVKDIESMKEYLSHVTQLAKQGAKIVVLPEKLVRITTAEQQKYEAIFSKSASDNQVYLEVGMKLVLEETIHNKAWIYAPDGKKIIDYDKSHMVMFLEDDYVVGKETAWFNDFGQTIRTVICKDMDFPATMRKYGQANVGLLLVPAWDWEGSERIHAQMAIVRGIENGYSIARSSKERLVTVSDRYGRTLAEQSTFDHKDATVVIDVPITPQITLYSKYGDWFGWLVVGGTIIAVLFLLGRLYIGKCRAIDG